VESTSSGNVQTQDGSLRDEITRLADSIRACDRLCLLGARTIVQCAVPLQEGRKDHFTFIPSITRDQHILGETRRHPTTSATCISALQSLLPIINRFEFEFGTHESKELTFHPIPSPEVFKAKNLRTKICEKINCSLAALQAFLIEDNLQSSATGWLGHLHPLTTAHVLRSLAPSKGLFEAASWRCLFINLWFLDRRASSSSGYPNIQETESPGTAFLTSKCIDALGTVYSVFERRRSRFEKLLGLMKGLKKAHDERIDLSKMSKDHFSEDIFCQKQKFEERLHVEDIRACLRDIALDNGLQGFYQDWSTRLEQKHSAQRNLLRTEDGQKFLLAAIKTFGEAWGGASRPRFDESIAYINTMIIEVEKIYQKISGRIKNHLAISDSLKKEADTSDDVRWHILPDWLCSADYWKSTKEVIKNPDYKWESELITQRVLQKLENHWLRHRNACERARVTVDAVNKYLVNIFDTFDYVGKTMKDHAVKDGDKLILDTFLSKLPETTSELERVGEQLLRALDAGIRWSEILMNRHLSYEASGAMARFDPCELAHAVRTVSRDVGRVRVGIILQALEVVCASQRADGTWSTQQPLFWDETGALSATSSIETAAAVVATANQLLAQPERYGASREEITERLKPVYDCLDRFFQWLSGSIQQIPIPPALAGKINKIEEEAPLYGWCSDRVFEPGRIHSGTTACAIDFLVNFRRFLQERINLRLRAEFVSHHPAELSRLGKVTPTDLAKLDKDEQPIIVRFKRYLRDHQLLEMIERTWLPTDPPKPEIKFWSGIFFGPPGTSKSLMAQAIAGELGWPLISLSPSDFLSRGEEHIESRAQEIFRALRAGSRLVYFFDEIDELIRDRSEASDRSAFPFLTPSFLTKFQDLRNQAKKNEFIFIIGTNYYDRIDSAAKRSGRFDQTFPIVYPDLESRASILLSHLQELFKSADDLRVHLTAIKEIIGDGSFLDTLAEFTGLVSYTGLQDFNRYISNLTTESRRQTSNANRQYVDDIVREVKKYNAREVGTVLKSEIDLVEYYRKRPNAIEEIEAVLCVLPMTNLLWDGKSKLNRAYALKELVKAVRSEKQLDKETKQKFVQKITKLQETRSRTRSRGQT
jgi:SpoVK/Ycf46/Vps4 family AAA+-type ATPase